MALMNEAIDRETWEKILKRLKLSSPTPQVGQ